MFLSSFLYRRLSAALGGNGEPANELCAQINDAQPTGFLLSDSGEDQTFPADGTAYPIWLTGVVQEDFDTLGLDGYNLGGYVRPTDTNGKQCGVAIGFPGWYLVSLNLYVQPKSSNWTTGTILASMTLSTNGNPLGNLICEGEGQANATFVSSVSCSALIWLHANAQIVPQLNNHMDVQVKVARATLGVLRLGWGNPKRGTTTDPVYPRYSQVFYVTPGANDPLPGAQMVQPGAVALGSGVPGNIQN